MKKFIVTVESEIEVEATNSSEALQKIYDFKKIMPMFVKEKDNPDEYPDYPIGACEACDKIILAGEEHESGGEDGILCAKCAKEIKE